MVEIFTTNVPQKEEADKILLLLGTHFPHHKINFDLEDCDKILRVEYANVQAEKIAEIVQQCGYQCNLLQD